MFKEVRTRAELHTLEGVEIVADIMYNDKSAFARLAAWTALRDTAFGKPPASLAVQHLPTPKIEISEKIIEVLPFSSYRSRSES
jgi:hypothetical protein